MEIDSENIVTKKRERLLPILTFFLTLFVAVNLISREVGQRLLERNDVGSYPKVALMGQNNLEIIQSNILHFFRNEKPLSPYTLEYGHGGVDLFLNSITVNLLNWALPSFIYDDLQAAFNWVNPITLVFYFCALFLILKIQKDTFGLYFLAYFFVIILLTQIPLYLMRGDSFAWYHVRYQILIPYLSILCIGRIFANMSHNSLTRHFISAFLLFLSILNLVHLVNSTRF